jgi:hypothetical protein
LFEKEGVQVLNAHDNRLLQHVDLPQLQGDNVFDIAEKGDGAYLTTSEGVYKVPLHARAQKNVPKGFLDYVIVNDKDTLSGNGLHLKYHQNNIQFYFSSPAFYQPDGVSFRYRLTGTETEWRATTIQCFGTRCI